MVQRLAVLLLLSALAGCTYSLGLAYIVNPEQSEDRLQLDNLICAREADIGWQSFGHQTTEFFLWPFSIPIERNYKRRTWQRCMAARGYRVVKPGAERHVEASAIPAAGDPTPEEIRSACTWTMTAAAWGRCAIEHGATVLNYCGDPGDPRNEKCVSRFNAAVAAGRTGGS